MHYWKKIKWTQTDYVSHSFTKKKNITTLVHLSPKIILTITKRSVNAELSTKQGKA